jgi:hypothetical protein
MSGNTELLSPEIQNDRLQQGAQIGSSSVRDRLHQLRNQNQNLTVPKMQGKGEISTDLPIPPAIDQFPNTLVLNNPSLPSSEIQTQLVTTQEVVNNPKLEERKVPDGFKQVPENKLTTTNKESLKSVELAFRGLLRNYNNNQQGNASKVEQMLNGMLPINNGKDKAA